MVVVVLVVFLVQQLTPTSTQQEDIELSFNYVLTPAVDPVHGVRLESTVPAVDLALQYVINATSLLPDVNLTYHKLAAEVGHS